MRELDLLQHPLLAVAMIEGCVVTGPSGERLQALVRGEGARPTELATTDETRAPVYRAARDLLRHSGYKPSGRNKPASEYLNKVFAQHGALSSIFNVVDVNNVVSLFSGLPISVFDGDRLRGSLKIAPGGDGESYVFNDGGQVLDLSSLLTVYHCPDGRWTPAGNAVKDSMATKVHENTKSVVVVIYSNRVSIASAYLSATCEWYATLLRETCGGRGIETRLLP